jgi:spermidine synthase
LFSLERRGLRVTLRGPEGRYSVYHPTRIFTGMGWDAQAASALLVAHSPRTALLLGYGGGTVARQLRAMFPAIRLTGVEIDGGIIKAAARHFSLREVDATVVAGCGERFVRRSRQRFDFVLDDMWDHDQRRPRAIVSDACWTAAVARRLTRGGVYAANVYGRRWAPADYDVAVERMRLAFAAVAEIRLPHERVAVLAGSAEPFRASRIAALLSRMSAAVRSALEQVDLTPC